jgi:hypothetical protein
MAPPQKKCFKCGKEKPIDEFYRHKAMADGHLGKCKDCTRKDTAERVSRLMDDPAWALSEKKRHQAKAKHMREVYPEKTKAHSSCKKKNGYNAHHWSYRKEHRKDVIYLTRKDHAKIHRYMYYDQERLMYRRLDGVLIDTREAAVSCYAQILSRSDEVQP